MNYWVKDKTVNCVIAFSVLYAFSLTLLGCGGKKEEKKNSPPSVTRAVIAPSPLRWGDDARVEYEVRDDDVDPVSISYQWERNGEKQYGDTLRTISTKKFKKGDMLSCILVPFDGKEKGKPFKTGQAKITNQPPYISLVDILPKPLKAGMEVKASVSASDPEGDPLDYSYEWFKNGSKIEGAITQSLPGNKLKKGDEVKVSVVASDGELKSNTAESRSVKVENTPPVFSSFPSPGQVQPGGYFQYQAVARDADGDAITFSLTSGPPGMVINPKSGLLYWQIPAVRNKSYTIVVVATDSDGGRAEQSFTLNF